MTSRGDFDIKNPALAEAGCKRIEWAWQEMPSVA